MLVIQIKTIFKETIGDHVTFTTVKILKMNTKFDYFYSSVQWLFLKMIWSFDNISVICQCILLGDLSFLSRYENWAFWNVKIDLNLWLETFYNHQPY